MGLPIYKLVKMQPASGKGASNFLPATWHILIMNIPAKYTTYSTVFLPRVFDLRPFQEMGSQCTFLRNKSSTGHRYCVSRLEGSWDLRDSLLGLCNTLILVWYFLLTCREWTCKSVRCRCVLALLLGWMQNAGEVTANEYYSFQLGRSHRPLNAVRRTQQTAEAWDRTRWKGV